MLNPLWIPSQPNLAPVIGLTRSITVSQTDADPAITLSITPSSANGAEYRWYRNGTLYATTSQSSYVYYPDEGDRSAYTWHVELFNQYGATISNSVSVYSWYYEKSASINAVINAMTAHGATVSSSDKNAITTFILNGINNGWWTKITAMYGLYGGLQASAAVNWKNPGTNDISWTNASLMTFDSGGVNPGASSSRYGLTGIMTDSFTDYNFECTFYTKQANTNTYQAWITGESSDSNAYGAIIILGSFNNWTGPRFCAYNNYSATAAMTSPGYVKGCFIAREESGHTTMYVNGTSRATGYNSSRSYLSQQFKLFGTYKSGNAGFTGYCGFFALSRLMTDSERTTYSTAVTALMTALGRI